MFEPTGSQSPRYLLCATRRHGCLFWWRVFCSRGRASPSHAHLPGGRWDGSCRYVQSFCLTLILPPRCWYSSIRWGREMPSSPPQLFPQSLCLIIHWERERKKWSLILLWACRQLWKNVFSIRHVLTLYYIWFRIIITVSSVSDSIVNGVLIPLQYRTMWLHYTLCKLSVA